MSELGSIQVGIELRLQELANQMAQVVSMFDAAFKKVDTETKQTAREYERQWAKANKEVEDSVKKSAAEFAKAEASKAAVAKKTSAEVEKEATKRIAIEDTANKAHVESVLKAESQKKAIRTKAESDYDGTMARHTAAFKAAMLEEVEASKAAAMSEERDRATAAKARMSSLPGAAGTVSRAGFAVGLPIAAEFIMATKTAADFDQAMRNVNSIAHLTEQQLASLRNETLKLAQDKSIRQTPKDLAEGLYQVYSAGKSGKEGLEILEWGAKGASAGMTDTATSTKVLLAVLNSGISGVNNAREAMNVLFQEVNLGVNSFPELANSIGNVLPTAKVVGVSIQEVAAAMAQMTRNGINADESVTSLNQMLTHIWKPGKEAEKLMTSLGISFGAAALEGKGLGGWLKEVMEKTHGNRDQLAHLIPEIRGAKGEFSLLSDGLKGYNELLGSMKKASEGVGQTTETLTRQNKGSVAQYELLKKEVDLTKIAIGEGLLPTVNDGIKKFREWLEEWNKQPKAARDAQTGIATFAAEVGLSIGVISSLVGWLAKLKTGLATLGVSGAAGLAATGIGTAVAGVGMMVKERQSMLDAIESGNKAAWQGAPNAKGNRPALESERKRIEQGLKEYAGIPAKLAELQKRKSEVGAALSALDIEGSAADDARKGHITDTKPKSPWGAGGYDRNAGNGAAKAARDAARERAREIKDAIKDTEDETRLTRDDIAARKELLLTGRELAVFKAQQGFDATMANAKTPARRGAAALLYQAQVWKAQESEALEAMRKSVAIYKEQTKVPEGVKDDSKEKGWGTLSGAMANAYAVQQYGASVAEAIAKEVEEQKRAQDEIMEYRRRMGEMTNAQYIKFLEQRVQAERTFGFGGKETSEQNPAFRDKNLELRQHYTDAMESIFGSKGRKGGKEGAKEIAEGISQGDKYMKRAMEGLSGGALGSLQKALHKGMKGGFGDILAHTLTDLLSNVLENAIASAFKKKKKKGGGAGDIFGGGGLLGSFLSPIAGLFGGGKSASVSRGINIHINGDNHFTNQTDVKEFGRTLAWQVQSELTRTVGGGI